MKIRKGLFSSLLLLVLVTACSNLPFSPGDLAAMSPTKIQDDLLSVSVTPSTTPAAAAQVISEHRIGVRIVEGQGEFYDRLSGEKFVPRGNNYISLDQMSAKNGGTRITFSMFNPGFYDREMASQALARMRAGGYNVVRIFIESEGVNGPGGQAGLNPAYMDNLAEFLELAKENQVYVIIAKQWLPNATRYGDIIAKQCCQSFNAANAIHLAPAGVEAHVRFFQDLIMELTKRGAPLDVIFSYNISNEFYFDGNEPPLSWDTGTVSLANGKTYDMANPQDKERIIDDATSIMIDEVRQAVLALDPTALVSIGFFVPQEPNPVRIGDARISRTRTAIWQSSADYIDLHAYPGHDLTLEDYLENFGMENMQNKPIILGEYGAFTGDFVTIEDAARALVNWQVESCNYGIDGWVLWEWDDSTQGEIVPAIAGDGVIANMLSPATRPDPCAYGYDFDRNLSLSAVVSASGFLPLELPENAIDELVQTQWGAGASAPQWIELDLGAPYLISQIRLQISQFPDGETIHILEVKEESGGFREVARFTQLTRSGEWLSFQPETPLERIRYVRVSTLSSPSWVGWKEIVVFGK